MSVLLVHNLELNRWSNYPVMTFCIMLKPSDKNSHLMGQWNLFSLTQIPELRKLYSNHPVDGTTCADYRFYSFSIFSPGTWVRDLLGL